MDETKKEEHSRARFLIVILAVSLAALLFTSAELWRVEKKLAKAEGKEKPDPVYTISGENSSIQPVDKSSDKNTLMGNINEWSPFIEMSQLHNEMNHIFNTAFGRINKYSAFSADPLQFKFNPSMDVTKTAASYTVTIDIPGANETDIQIDIKPTGVLLISGVRNHTNNPQLGGNSTIRQERFTGRFQRTILFEEPVDVNGMETSYENGVLTIVVPINGPIDETQSTFNQKSN